MGTPDLAATCLEGLLDSGAVETIAVVTQPDKPKGRELKLQPPPVKQLALRHQLPVLQPERVRDPAFHEALLRLAPDLIVVAAYGRILPQAVLDLPRFGCINVHTSLLPKYRRAAPIQWAILNGDAETGVTIMKMDAGMDTGDILAQEKTSIGADETSAELHDRLASIGAELVVRTIPEHVAGHLRPIPQPTSGASHAARIKKEDGKIDWTHSANAIRNRIRAFTPWPGAFTTIPLHDSRRTLKIWSANAMPAKGQPGTVLAANKSEFTVACGDGSLALGSIQPEGGRRMSAQEFLAGHPVAVGMVLGSGG